MQVNDRNNKQTLVLNILFRVRLQNIPLALNASVEP
jgi:hypothetical protein